SRCLVHDDRSTAGCGFRTGAGSRCLCAPKRLLRTARSVTFDGHDRAASVCVIMAPTNDLHACRFLQGNTQRRRTSCCGGATNLAAKLALEDPIPEDGRRGSQRGQRLPTSKSAPMDANTLARARHQLLEQARLAEGELSSRLEQVRSVTYWERLNPLL